MKIRSTLLILTAFGLVLAQSALPAVTPPQLPQHTVDTSVPTVTGKSITVNSGGDLQAAINAVNPGDEIVLQAGATWTGNYVLPNKSAASIRHENVIKPKTASPWIVIRSSNMNKLPPSGTRVSPKNAADMPRIQAAGSSTAFFINAKANHYRLMGLEITEQPKQYLNYGLIMQGDPADTNAADLPSYITVDRCYLHGLVLSHIKFGWQMNGSYLAVVDSYVSEFHGIGQDTQAIAGYMGTGPLKISNDFLEASGENTLFGGAYDAIPNTTTADVTFTNNYVYKPQMWMTQSIIPAPMGGVAVVTTGSGDLPSGTYYYSVIAQGRAGVLNDPSSCQSSRSLELTVNATGAQNTVKIGWTAETYGDAADTRTPDSYVVARTTDAPTASTRTWVYFLVTSNGFTDDANQTPINGYGEWARYWDVKNLFEIKNGVRWKVDSNVFDSNWVQAQNGFSIVLTPRMETPTMPGNRVQDITFSNNVVRHVAGGINLSSEDDNRQAIDWESMVPSSRIAFINNLFEDVNWYYNGNGNFMEIEAGSEATLPGAQDVTMDHNTVFQKGNFITLSSGPALNNFSFTNNVFGEGTYGWTVSGLGQAYSAIQQMIQNITFTNNVWAGDPTAYQVPNNNFPGAMTDIGFVNYNNGSGGDYHLAASSPYKGKGTKGTDPGADMNVLNGVIKNALAGTTSNSGSGTPTPTKSKTLWYQIAVVNSQKCLTAQKDGSVAQFACDQKNNNQMWSIKQLSNGFEFFTYSKIGGYGLNVWGAGAADGQTIGLYKLTGQGNEVFSLKSDLAGHFALNPVDAPKSCWDVRNSNQTDGNVLQQWTCNGGANQSFDFLLINVK